MRKSGELSIWLAEAAILTAATLAACGGNEDTQEDSVVPYTEVATSNADRDSLLPEQICQEIYLQLGRAANLGVLLPTDEAHTFYPRDDKRNILPALMCSAEVGTDTVELYLDFPLESPEPDGFTRLISGPVTWQDADGEISAFALDSQPLCGDKVVVAFVPENTLQSDNSRVSFGCR